MSVRQGSVILHPTRGTNSRQLVCPACNREGGHIMLGVKEFAAGCDTCGAFNIGLLGHETECPKCNADGFRPVLIPPESSLPGLCEPCKVEIAEKSETIRKGGVFWGCEDCGNTGTLEAGHPAAIEARELTGVSAPDPCGAELSRETCPVCLGGKI